jgi:hypothetical protein
MERDLGSLGSVRTFLSPLKTPAPSRVVVVSWNLHSSGKIDFDDLATEKSWRGSYPRSKLANMLFVRALAAPIRLTAKWRFKSPEQGAHTSLYLATAPGAAEVSGRYFVNATEKKPSPASLDDAHAERLWTETEHLVARAIRPAAPRGTSAPTETFT